MFLERTFLWHFNVFPNDVCYVGVVKASFWHFAITKVHQMCSTNFVNNAEIEKVENRIEFFFEKKQIEISF